MTMWDYLDKHDNQFPYGDEDTTMNEISNLELCRSKEEELYELNLLLKVDGEEKFKLFREFCIDFNSIPHIFSPDGTGIGDQLINQA